MPYLKIHKENFGNLKFIIVTGEFSIWLTFVQIGKGKFRKFVYTNMFLYS